MSDFALLHRAAEAALDRGDLRETSRLSQGLIAAKPDFADGHFLAGMAAAGQGDIRGGLDLVDTAIALSPDAHYLAQQARLLLTVRREDDALAAADRAAKASPEDALTLDTIGCVYTRLGEHGLAAPLFEQAVARDPRDAQYRFNLASALGFLGRFDEAAKHYETIIASHPGFAKAHLALSSLKRASTDANHLDRLEQQLGRTGDPAERLHLHYAAAKEYEDLKDHAAAFRHLTLANTRRKAELGYDITADRGIFDSLRDRFGRPDYFQGAGCTQQAPLFVLGLPRTGTTLVDRILSSHPDVTSAGELQAMPLAVKMASGVRTRMALDPQTIDGAGAISPGGLGEAYLARAVSHRRQAEGRFIDKLPLNFLYAGYIARALPEASIVCLRRHPMDSVWSNYKNLFATGFSYYNYAYDLLDTAAYYVMFDRLMAFWEELFPGRILQVRYEDIVDDQEGQTRKLLAHCGLDWSDACMNFQDNQAAVSTPSATQVRRPIYRDAVARWRLYAEPLAPVADYFRAHGVEI
jgi:thioredoxin-like negative regulator of GroEL